MKVKITSFRLYKGKKPYIVANTSLGSMFETKLSLKDGIKPEEAEAVVNALNEYIKELSIN